MADTEDYLDGLLDRVSKARDDMDSDRRRSRRERSGRRKRVSTDEDYMEARGLKSDSDRGRRRSSRRSHRSGKSDDDDFLKDFEKNMFGDLDDDFGGSSAFDAEDDFLKEFERELDSGSDSDDFDLDSIDTSEDIFAEADDSEDDASDDLLDGIADIVSEAKRQADSDAEPSASEDVSTSEAVDEPEVSAAVEPLDDIPDEPDLSAEPVEEVPLMDEVGEDVDLMDLLNSDEGGDDLSDIGDLLNADESGDELDESKDSFEAAAADAEEGGQGAEGAEAAEDGDKQKKAPAAEKKGGLFSKMFGSLFKKDTEEDEEEEQQEEEEEEDGDEVIETPEEKKARKKAEKEEKKKKKKEEADKKKKEKEAAKKEKEARKKEKAAAKAKAKARRKKQKDKSPKIPLPGILVFVLFGLSLVALSQVVTTGLSYSTSIKQAQDDYDKENYMEAYRLVESMELKETDQEFRDKAKNLAYLQLKYQQYQYCLAQNKNQMALDSLISGVYYYQKNKKAANKLGITEIYDAQGAILTKELMDAFDLSPEDAVKIYKLPTRKRYTAKIQEKLEAVGLEVDR